jgi:hypothetical protein
MVKNKGKRKWYLMAALLVLLAAAIYTLRPQKSNYTPPPSDVVVRFETQRFDQELWALRDSLQYAVADAFKERYRDFLPFYASTLVQLGRPNDPQLLERLQAYLHDPYIDTVYRDVLQHFADFSPFDSQFNDAFRFLKMYFPQAPTYDIITHVSGFQYKTALIDSAVLVGLDLYLGRDYRYYPKVEYMTAYLMRRLDDRHLVPDAMQLILEDLIPEFGNSNKLLHRMLEQGKALYALKKVLPNTPDSTLFGYTTTQMNWVTENETNIWAYMLNRDILFTTDLGELARFMQDGPFTNGLPEEAPARLGHFIGYRIINVYMEQNKQTALADLFADNDYDTIFKKSAYKGR